MRALRALHSAVAMYTWLPVRKHDWTDSDFPDGLVAFPWLGLALGGAAGSLGWGATAVSGSLFLGAVLALGAVAFVTGAMHLDGTADVADALGSRKPAEQARAIMSSPTLAPWGDVAVVHAPPGGRRPLRRALPHLAAAGGRRYGGGTGDSARRDPAETR